MAKSKGPCGDGYEMIGTKSKGGSKVPNCIPKKSKGGETEYNGSLINSEINGVKYNNKSYENYYKNIL